MLQLGAYVAYLALSFLSGYLLSSAAEKCPKRKIVCGYEIAYAYAFLGMAFSALVVLNVFKDSIIRDVMYFSGAVPFLIAIEFGRRRKKVQNAPDA